MKYLKIFEEFERGGFSPLNSKQIKIANNFVIDNYPYINVELDFSDVFVSSDMYAVGENYCDSLAEVIEKHKLPGLFSKYGLKDYTITDDGFINVKEFTILNTPIEILPFNFGEVKEHFKVSNTNLKSLKGAPHTVLGDFDCHYNKIETLIGGPKIVKGRYSCSHNKLTNLIGAPEEISGNLFSCNNNKLITLQGAPRRIEGSFNCSNNQLKDLEGAPIYIGKLFNCINNNLTTLKGMPKYVGGNILCEDNDDLHIIDYLPDEFTNFLTYSERNKPMDILSRVPDNLIGNMRKVGFKQFA